MSRSFRGNIIYTIGLGYTGAKTAYQISKTLKELVAREIEEHIVKVRIIDTAKDSLDEITQTLDPEGKFVKREDIIWLGGYPDLKSYFDDPLNSIDENEKKNCNWFPWDDSRLISDLKSFGIGTGGVGRNRILSRFVVECIPPVRKLIKNSIREDLATIKNNLIQEGVPLQDISLIVWITFGLGGGTGSGMFIPILSIVGDVIKELGMQAKIFPIAVLPTQPEASNIEAANGYAALKDLSCIIAKGSSEASAITAPMLTGFAESRSEKYDISSIYELVDEKMADFIATIHFVPVGGGAQQIDWNNILQDTIPTIMSSYNWPLAVAVYDTIKITIPIDKLKNYLITRLEYDKLMRELTVEQISPDVLNKAYNYLFNKLSVNDALNVVNATMMNMTLATRQKYLEELAEKVENTVKDYISDFLASVKRLLENELKELTKKKWVSDITKSIIMDVYNKYNKISNNNIENITLNDLIELNQSINRAKENTLSDYNRHCSNRIFLKSRCFNNLESTRTHLNMAVQELGEIIAKLKIGEEFLAKLSLLQANIESELKEKKSNRKVLDVKMRGLKGSLVSNFIVKRISTNTYHLMFSEKGLERLYQDVVKPYIDKENELNKVMSELEQRGIKYFATAGGKNKESYLAGDLEAVKATIQNAIHDLHEIPVALNISELNKLKDKKIIKDLLWMLYDTEDKEIIEESTSSKSSVYQKVGKDVNKLGPRVYMARLIIPVDIRIINDIKELKEAYEHLGYVVSHHAVPDAMNIDIIDMAFNDIIVKCKGGISKDKMERAEELIDTAKRYLEKTSASVVKRI